jgi:hypothetical protein
MKIPEEIIPFFDKYLKQEGDCFCIVVIINNYDIGKLDLETSILEGIKVYSTFPPWIAKYCELEMVNYDDFITKLIKKSGILAEALDIFVKAGYKKNRDEMSEKQITSIYKN